MSLSITFEPELGSYTVNEYLSEWSGYFDIGGHGYSNNGAFGLGGYSGNQYAVEGSLGSMYAFIASSETPNGLHLEPAIFMNPEHNLNNYFWGSLDGIALGEAINGDLSGHYSMVTQWVSFNGLDLDAAFGAGRAGNPVHETLFGLARGDTSVLSGVLDNLLADYGVSTDSTFDDIAIALANGPASVASAETVGVQVLAIDALAA